MIQFDGAKLKELRKRKNLKQRELAELVGKQATHIANYENGVTSPPADVLLNFISIFEIDASELGKPGQIATV